VAGQPAGTVTLLFTDIEGSTRLLDELGAEAYREALAEHRRVLREAFERHGGYEVDYEGDAFFVAFAEASAAVAAATDGQAGLADAPIRVRIGLHTGTPLLDPPKYVGVDVHLAARIMAAAHGGQIVVSKTAAEHAGDGPAWTDLGEHRLKDFPEPVWLYQLGEGVWPPLRTISNTNLPRPASSFVGREREVGEIAALLTDGARLLTLMGPGGSGKTRLALEAAAELVPAFRNGVFWVGLASLRDPDLVLETVAQTLGAKHGVADHVGERELLLLLDNLEQVIDAAPALASLLGACRNLRLLVTSRELLRVRGEVEFAVPPLAEDEAVELFVRRSGLERDDTVAELCRRLDNLPLAVELAAARTAVLSPEQILDRLGERLDLLKAGRDADARQRTLRATIEWSHGLLTADEKALFARLAVFEGGCTLAVAEEVAEADLDTQQSLVDKSLVRHTGERFWMLETIRQYALERLEKSDDADALRARHCRYYLAWAEEAAPHLRGADQGEWLGRVDIERADLRAALAWSVRRQPELALRLGAALRRYWWARSLLVEGSSWLDRLVPLARSERGEPSVWIFVGAGALAREQGRWEEAAALHEEGLEIARALDAPRHVAGCEHELAIDLLVGGSDLARARRLFESSLAGRRETGDVVGVTQTLSGLSAVVQAEGDLLTARALLTESLELARELGAQESIAGLLCNLVLLALEGVEDLDIDWARACLRESLDLFRELGQPVFTGGSLEALAAVEHAAGNAPHAVLLLASAARMRESVGASLAPDELALHQRTSAALRSALGDAAYEDAWQAAGAMSPHAAIEAALQPLEG
jgi:predicted ATPase